MSGIEVAFFGTLGRDAEQKTSAKRKTYLMVSVRVGDGDDVQLSTVLAFDEKAIEAAASFIKGALVYVEGKLLTSEWTGKDGEKRLGLNVMSFHCRLAQIGRNKSKAYHSKRLATAGRLPDAEKANGARCKAFVDEDIPFAPEMR